MLDFETPIGKRIWLRLRDDEVIWLTTVDSDGDPQPRPVWFHWDGSTLMILSQQNAAKIRHIRRSPRVALNFNTDSFGGDVAVLIGEASLGGSVSPERMAAYLNKYQSGIADLGMTPEKMVADYPVVILVTPKAMRGF